MDFAKRESPPHFAGSYAWKHTRNISTGRNPNHGGSRNAEWDARNGNTLDNRWITELETLSFTLTELFALKK